MLRYGTSEWGSKSDSSWQTLITHNLPRLAEIERNRLSQAKSVSVDADPLQKREALARDRFNQMRESLTPKSDEKPGIDSIRDMLDAKLTALNANLERPNLNDNARQKIAEQIAILESVRSELMDGNDLTVLGLSDRLSELKLKGSDDIVMRIASQVFKADFGNVFNSETLPEGDKFLATSKIANSVVVKAAKAGLSEEAIKELRHLFACHELVATSDTTGTVSFLKTTGYY